MNAGGDDGQHPFEVRRLISGPQAHVPLRLGFLFKTADRHDFTRTNFLCCAWVIGEVRQPIPAEPGQLERYDCEYKRNGTANLFIFLDVHRPWRKVKVTDSRAAVDFAACMRELTDVHFPKAERIRVVLDNLSTHSAGALYQAFPAAEARRVLRRLEFHYVPKHASWLNMVEIEIGVLRSQCLDRRIASQRQLESEVAAWQRRRNASQARIKWMFTTEKARVKMGCAYPEPNSVRVLPTKES
jgi:DDE superfamily endonuclease